jgi:hypothetical protein
MTAVSDQLSAISNQPVTPAQMRNPMVGDEAAEHGAPGLVARRGVAK